MGGRVGGRNVHTIGEMSVQSCMHFALGAGNLMSSYCPVTTKSFEHGLLEQRSLDPHVDQLRWAEEKRLCGKMSNLHKGKVTFVHLVISEGV